jgi:hypothetical protein
MQKTFSQRHLGFSRYFVFVRLAAFSFVFFQPILGWKI